MKYQFIFAGHVRYPISLQCEVLDVSRAGYYQWRSRTTSSGARANAALVARMKVLHLVHKGRYGSPRMTVALQREGYACSRNRVARLMRLDGLAARVKRKYCRTTVSDHRAASENLIKRQFAVTTPDHVLTSDITYIPTNEGWLYLGVVLDLCTRKVIGLSMRSDMTAELVSDALKQAIARRTRTSGTILHSDRGVQYSSDAYRSIITKHGFIQSMSRKGDCWDNAPMESFFKTLKVELIYPKKQYQTREEAQKSIFEYIERYYNRQRIHSALNYQSPEEFEANLTTTTSSNRHINCMGKWGKSNC